MQIVCPGSCCGWTCPGAVCWPRGCPGCRGAAVFSCDLEAEKGHVLSAPTLHAEPGSSCLAAMHVYPEARILLHHLLPLPLPSTVIRFLDLASTVGAHVIRCSSAPEGQAAASDPQALLGASWQTGVRWLVLPNSTSSGDKRRQGGPHRTGSWECLPQAGTAACPCVGHCAASTHWPGGAVTVWCPRW